MKSESRKLQDRLWKLCKTITLNKYGNTCYTCGATNLVAGNCQLGHCIPSGACGAFLRYDLRNLRIQCMRCNIHLGGNGAEYVRRLEKEIGKKAVEQLFKDKQKSVKATDHYAKLIKEYELILRE